MTNSQKRQEYAGLLVEKMQKGDITLEEKQTINDYKRDLSRAIVVRAVPSSLVMFAYYTYRNKGSRIGLFKASMCCAGGLLFGIFATPGKKLWERAMERNHITPQHVLGKMAQALNKSQAILDETLDQEIQILKAEKRSRPAGVLTLSDFPSEKSKPGENLDDSQQTTSGLSLFSGGANQETSEQSMDDQESLMKKRLRRHRKHRTAGEEGNTTEENTYSGKKVNKYGDPIE